MEKNIVFRHRRGHTEKDDKHIGSILNRAADAECTKIKNIVANNLKGLQTTDTSGRILKNIGKAIYKDKRKTKDLTGDISVGTIDL